MNDVLPTFKQPINWLLCTAAVLFATFLTIPHTIALRVVFLFLFLGLIIYYVRQYSLKPLPLKLPLTLWSGLAVVSLLWSINPDLSSKELKHEIIFPLVCFWAFYILGTLKGEKHQQVFMWAVLSSVTTKVAICAYFYYTYKTLELEGPHGGVGKLSTYFVLAIPFLFYLATTYPNRAIKGIVALVFASSLIFTYLTYNRFVWVALLGEAAVIIGLLVNIPKLTPRKKLAITGGSVVALLLLAVLFTISIYHDYPEDTPFLTVLGGAFNDDPRVGMWHQALQIISQHPLLGYGFGQDILAVTDYRLGYFLHPHNLFLSFAIQLGLIGVAVLVVLLASLARQLLNHVHSSDRTTKLLTVSALACLTGMIVKNMTDGFYHRDLVLMFWCLMGYTLGYLKLRTATR